MLDLINLLIRGTLMIILAMSPFFIGFGFLFYTLYFFMNGKHKDVIENIKYYNKRRKEKKGAWTIKKDKNGKYILKVGGSEK